MPRRVNLPAADDLFRPTGKSGGETEAKAARTSVRAVPDSPDEKSTAKTGASGRIRHDEKMTVYVTAAELLEIEQARLTLRGAHGLSVDRGRLVREALHLALADFDANGEDSALVRRLREQ